ncbi:glycoside hydrolase family 43 protein [Polyplosphaeria fusca]|uniref:Glycoside hydrolase family 43 protein n=1 Tax=Polyplosphaeria fusca TaxID=682080 RepID=A0A9P4QRU2_9PLEO|nr:glycoside hydrolase family 43 protein [Polyplosphaeria fusca]
MLSIAFLLFALVSAKYIIPGGRWYDTSGSILNAHAGCIVLSNGTFWLFGEYKTQGQIEGGGIAVYSSPDLATWTPHGLALTPVAGHSYISPENIIQRPKVVWSEESRKWHMHWHADNAAYGLLLQGLAESSRIQGPYTFVRATTPLGNWSQDFGLFTDYKSHKSYSLYSNGDRKEARDVYITAYDNSNSNLTSIVHRFPKYDLEAPTVLQTDSSYFALMSHKTGYRPNNVVAFRADHLSGPWSQPYFIAPPYTRTYNSQSGFTLRIAGTQATTHLYIGDQWDSNSLWESRYIWLPLTIGTTASGTERVGLEWHDVYDLDVRTGVVRGVNGTAYYAADAEVAGDAELQEATFTATGVIATGIAGNSSTVTFGGVQGSGGEQWVSFYYQNTDDMGFGDQPGGSPDRVGGAWALRRISGVVVNGRGEEVQTLYQRDTHKGVVLSAPLKLRLEKGANRITVGGLWNGVDVKGADLDRIVVYPVEEG